MSTKIEEVRIKVAQELQKKWLDPDKIKGWLANTKDRKIPAEAQEQIAEVIRSLFAEYGLRPDLGHIVVLGDRPYVTREGLLYYARKSGQLKGIKVQVVERRKDFCLVKATVLTKDGGEFEAFGDADTSNTNRMVSPHLIRMAETRAINRALREAFPIGLCSYEELSESDALYDPETGEVISHGRLDSSSNDIGSSSGSSNIRVNSKPITEAQIRAIKTMAKDIWGERAEKEGKALLSLLFKKESTKELTREEASTFIRELKSIQEEKAKKKADEEFFLSQ